MQLAQGVTPQFKQTWMTVSEGPSLVYYLSPKGLHNAVSEDLNYTTQNKAMLFLLGTVPEEETVHQDRVMLEQAHQEGRLWVKNTSGHNSRNFLYKSVDKPSYISKLFHY